MRARIAEHRGKGPTSAAWLRCCTELTGDRIDTAAELQLALKKEAVHTGWNLAMESTGRGGGSHWGIDVVRGACVTIPTIDGRGPQAWSRRG